MRDITAAELVSEINLGWNLGETLDSWSSDAGYDDYHNSNAYQLVLRYDNAEHVRSTSIATQFDTSNKCSYKWSTGLIDSDENAGLGDIGFEIWNLTVEEDTEITINVTKALLTRRTGVAYNIDDLLGRHTITITKYGTTAVLSKKFPSNLSRTYGITDGTFEVAVELVDFPQKEYGKSAYFETLWNNPITTYEMIEQVRAAGFNAVRVPVTFFNHTVSDTNVVDSAWLDRVQEVVDYAYYQDMYCVLCMYNDGSSTGWLRVNTDKSDAVKARYASIWKQVSERFRDYGDHLIFQGYNELTDDANTWSYPGEADVKWLNSLGQLFVDTVRATGGNNSTRCLMLSPYAGSSEQEMIDGLVLPKDSAANRLIVGVTANLPAEFVYSVDEATTSFTDVYEWGSAEDKTELDQLFSRLNSRFTANGVPVVITEFCSADKGNTEARTAHAAYYAAAGAKRGIPCFWWDDGGLLLRKALAWSYPEIVDGMVDATSIHLKHVKVEGLGQYYYTGENVIPELTLTYSPPRASGASADSAVSAGDPTAAGAVTLVNGVDYDFICFDNIKYGEAQITIFGKGNYSGVINGVFSIVEEPRAVDLFTRLAGDDHSLPFVVMLSIPLFLVLGFYSVYSTMKRRERTRVSHVIELATREEIEARKQEELDLGREAIYKSEEQYRRETELDDYLAEDDTYSGFGGKDSEE